MTTKLNARIGEVTERIAERSRPSRKAYLARVDAAAAGKPARKRLGCANFAHGFAACATGDKEALREGTGPNLAIVTAYNDMLSAHQPYARFPDLIREAARAAGGTAQVAGGVPAMCDGVTQGETGMELSLFSRDVIALSTAVALVARHVRRGGLSRRLRQDRARPPDRRALVRPSAGGVPARRADAFGPRQRRKVEDPSALRGRQGDPRGPARGGGQGLSLAGHLHLLRHRQHQPDADGDHGPAFAGRVLRQSQHAAARRADRARASSGRWRSRRSAINSRRSATSSTSARSSTASSGCTRRAARPISPSIWSRWRPRPASR